MNQPGPAERRGPKPVARPSERSETASRDLEGPSSSRQTSPRKVIEMRVFSEVTGKPAAEVTEEPVADVSREPALEEELEDMLDRAQTVSAAQRPLRTVRQVSRHSANPGLSFLLV